MHTVGAVCYFKKNNFGVYFFHWKVNHYVKLAWYFILQPPDGSLYLTHSYSLPNSLAFRRSCSQVLCGKAVLNIFITYADSHLWSKSASNFTKIAIHYKYIHVLGHVFLSWRRPLSYRHQSIDLLRKSMDWFLYDNGLRLERVNSLSIIASNLIWEEIN